MRAVVRLDHLEPIPLRRQRLDRLLHELPRDALPPMRDHDARAAVVRVVAIKAVEDEPGEPVAVERAGREVRTEPPPRHELPQILDRIVRRDVVVAERVVERRRQRLERLPAQVADLDQCATTSGASSPTPRMTSSTVSPPRSSANAVRQTRAISSAEVRTSGTPLRSITNAPATVRPIFVPPDRVITSDVCSGLHATIARAWDSLKRSANASMSSAWPPSST